MPMPLDWPVRSVAGQREFWERFFFRARHHEPYPGLRCNQGSKQTYLCNVEFFAGEARGLVLEFTLDLARFTLRLTPQQSSPDEVATDCMGNNDWLGPFRDALRWEEVDLICKCAMIR